MNDQTETPGKAVELWEETRLNWHPALEARLAPLKLDRRDWKTICEVIFPSATSVNSILMALDYCRARKLDVMKRMAHIVPVWSTAAGKMVDTIWPAIAELRTTAMRTKDYAGTDRMEFGPMITEKFKTDKGHEIEVTFPEWAQITVYRMVHGQRVAFNPPPVYWIETYGTLGKSEAPNSMWRRRARGQLGKCCEAAALRFTFPEELGNDYAAEEMEGQQFVGPDNAKVVNQPSEAPATPPPSEAAEPPAETAESEPEDVAQELAEQGHPEEAEQVLADVDADEPETENPNPDEETARLGRKEMFDTLSNQIVTFAGDYDDLKAWAVLAKEDIEYIGEVAPKSAKELNDMILDALRSLQDAVDE